MASRSIFPINKATFKNPIVYHQKSHSSPSHHEIPKKYVIITTMAPQTISHSNQHKTNTRGDKCWKWFVRHESCVIKIEGPRFWRVVIVSKNCKHADLKISARNLLGLLFNYTPDFPQQSFPRAIMTAGQIRTVFSVSHRSDFRFSSFFSSFSRLPIWQPIFRAMAFSSHIMCGEISEKCGWRVCMEMSHLTTQNMLRNEAVNTYRICRLSATETFDSP